MKEKEAILIRIKKLMKHAESARELGSLAEAESFAKKANELLVQHNLSMMDVAMAADETEDFSNYVYAESISYHDNQSGNTWKKYLVAILVKHNLCNYTVRQRQHTFRVYGKMENVDVVIWMYNFLSIGLLRLAQEHHVNLPERQKRTYNRYAFLKDFLLGAVFGIDAKLEEQRVQMAKDSNLYALIKVNDEALAKFIHIKVGKLKDQRGVGKPITVGNAYETGYKAGKNYSITKPLKGGGPKPKELGS